MKKINDNLKELLFESEQLRMETDDLGQVFAVYRYQEFYTYYWKWNYPMAIGVQSGGMTVLRPPLVGFLKRIKKNFSQYSSPPRLSLYAPAKDFHICRSVLTRSVIISLKGGKLHFQASIGALFFLFNPFISIGPLWGPWKRNLLISGRHRETIHIQNV